MTDEQQLILNEIHAADAASTAPDDQPRFAVTFTKKDGSERTLRSRLGITRGVRSVNGTESDPTDKGPGLAFDPLTRGMLPLFDLDLEAADEPPSKCWRMVTLARVTEIMIL